MHTGRDIFVKSLVANLLIIFQAGTALPGVIKKGSYFLESSNVNYYEPPKPLTMFSFSSSSF